MVWTVRFRVVDRHNFDEMSAGIKNIETRAASEKYAAIKVGDVFRFVCGKRVLEKKVARKRHFTSIGAMLKEIPYKKIMPFKNSAKEVYAAYYSYPNYKEKIRSKGIFAFYLK
jgi:ASC-1-like (ASCH) protein